MKRSAAVAAALVLLPVFAAAAHRHYDSQSLQQQIQAQRVRAWQLQANLRRKRHELNTATQSVNFYQSQLQETNAAIVTVDGELHSLAVQQRDTERTVAWYGRQLAAAKRSLAFQDNLLKRRLVDVYEYGTPDYLSVLLAARSFSDFVESWDDLRLLIAANQRAVRARAQIAERVAAVQRRFEAAYLTLVDEEQRQTHERNTLGTLASERTNLLGVADVARQRIKSEYDAMEALTASEEMELENLIAQQDRIEGIEGTPAHSDGYFSWPVSGIITSPFGWRENPFGGGPEFHQGLDIAAALGTPVVAAAAGTVIMAQWYGGYGNYVLIDNGNHYSTGYGHLNAIYVARGQYVQRGQAIGAVGSTGYSTGPHLHFEVRIDGKPVDPAPRLIH